jgi:hypothetical protein
MSNYTPTSTTTDRAHTDNGATTTVADRRPARRISTETKASFKTSEFFIFLAAVAGVLVASAVADEASDFGTQEAWFYVTLLTIGYLVSRGLAKSGSRDFYDDDNR